MKARSPLLAICTTLFAGPGLAAHLDYYSADLSALNQSGVRGTVFLTYDGPEDDGLRKLRVQVAATGLEPGGHAAHIHGFSDSDAGGRRASIAPTDDVFMPNVAREGNDGDGFTELSEGAPFYGGILQTLTGLEADAVGRVFYDMSFDVAEGSELDDNVFSLDNREIVLHGLTTKFEPVGVLPGAENLGGDIDGFARADPNFNALLPIATAKFERATLADQPYMAPVPLPAAGWLLIAGVGGLGLIRRYSARRD